MGKAQRLVRGVLGHLSFKKLALVAAVIVVAAFFLQAHASPDAGPPRDAAAAAEVRAVLDGTSVAAAGEVVRLRTVDGGAGYYGGFSNPLPASRAYFPIAVWSEYVYERSQVVQDRKVGLNTYVVLTSDSNLRVVRANGMRAFVQAEERGRFEPQPGAETAAWELSDEIDMRLSPAEGLAELRRIESTLPDDNRLRYNNFGKGVMFWESDDDARRYVNSVDLPSTDVYWFTDPSVCDASEGGEMFTGGSRSLSDAECRRASNYGAVVARTRSLVSPAGSKPVWALIEVGHPFTEADAPTISGSQIRAAVWHSLIAGARGIIYFNHSFGGRCTSQHVLREACGAAVRPIVAATNARLRSLAPVLNAPTLTSGFGHSRSTRALAKFHAGHFYIIAGSAENARSTSTFAIPCVGNAVVTVLDERRKIRMTKGRFRDAFATGNAVHLYRIDGGSDCGLSAPRRG